MLGVEKLCWGYKTGCLYKERVLKGKKRVFRLQDKVLEEMDNSSGHKKGVGVMKRCQRLSHSSSQQVMPE